MFYIMFSCTKVEKRIETKANSAHEGAKHSKITQKKSIYRNRNGTVTGTEPENNRKLRQ